ATIGLVIIPLIFSLLFFAVPAIRTLGVKRENKRRHAKNIRKLVLKEVFEASQPPGETVVADNVVNTVNRSLKQIKTEGEPAMVTDTMRQTVAEFDADIDIDDSGRELYKFPTVTRAFLESQQVRDKLALERQKLGDIVFSSADTQEEADARDLRVFEKELAGSENVEAQVEEVEEAGSR